MIYKILKKVFDDSVLLEFTYGLRNKDNFSLLAINKVIIGKFYICEFFYYVNFELEWIYLFILHLNQQINYNMSIIYFKVVITTNNFNTNWIVVFCKIDILTTTTYNN